MSNHLPTLQAALVLTLLLGVCVVWWTWPPPLEPAPAEERFPPAGQSQRQPAKADPPTRPASQFNPHDVEETAEWAYAQDIAPEKETNGLVRHDMLRKWENTRRQLQGTPIRWTLTVNGVAPSPSDSMKVILSFLPAWSREYERKVFLECQVIPTMIPDQDFLRTLRKGEKLRVLGFIESIRCDGHTFPGPEGHLVYRHLTEIILSQVKVHRP